MSSFLDQAYHKSPIWSQQLMVAGYGWWWYRRRFGPQFHQLVLEYQERERWSTTQFAAYQLARFQDLLDVSWHSPYYSNIWSVYQSPRKITSLEDIRRFPVLNKETLRTSARLLLTQDPIPRGTIIQRSSGTTGTPTDIYYTRPFHALELAVPEARNLHWAGVNYRSRRVMLGVRKVARFDQSTPPFWRFSPVENMAYASIYHLSPKYLSAYMDFFRNFHPDVVMGYPSALYTIAAYALEAGDLPKPARAVITMSETLLPMYREAIEEAWRCKILDRYGAVEGCMFVGQCEFGRYHISPEVGIIEILDSNGNPCAPGEYGEVICTGLQNTLQPLIRYRVGDVACWSLNQSCPCGREMPIIEGVEGRFEDMCFTPDGRQMLRFDTVFKGVTNIKEAQVVQEELDLFTVYVVPATGFAEADVHMLQENMRMHVGNVTTQVRLVTQLERSSSGKLRAVICRLPSEKKAMLRRQMSQYPKVLS